MRYLGIDYGTKRIGIALSNETNEYALPHSIIVNSPTAAMEIKKICDANDVGLIIMGESKNFKGEDNPIMGQITLFKKALEGLVGIPAELHPEFLSSAQASRIQGNVRMLDASAAAVILQDYLNKKANK